MTATNHAMSGALIFALLPLRIAFPLAFASHFVLDTLPHYGIPHNKRDKSPVYRLIVFSDTFIALSIAALALILHKWRMETGGWVAYSPDALWVFCYFKQGKNLRIAIASKSRFMRFHRRIQVFERPWGIFVDLAAGGVMFPFFAQQLLK